MIGYDLFQLNHLQKHRVEKYSFEISYPSHYRDNQKEEEELDYTSRVKITVSGEEIANEMESLKMSENVISVKSNYRKMRMLVDAISVPKSTLDIEEICKRHIVMFRIYNEEAKIKESRIDKEIINQQEVGKVEITVEGKENDSKVVAYLLSLADKEITVTFIMPESEYSTNQKEIEKIMNSIKF